MIATASLFLSFFFCLLQPLFLVCTHDCICFSKSGLNFREGQVGGGVKANTQNTSKLRKPILQKKMLQTANHIYWKRCKYSKKKDKYCRKSKIFLKGAIETNGMGYTCCFNFFKTAFCSHFLLFSFSFHMLLYWFGPLILEQPFTTFMPEKSAL